MTDLQKKPPLSKTAGAERFCMECVLVGFVCFGMRKLSDSARRTVLFCQLNQSEHGTGVAVNGNLACGVGNHRVGLTV